MAIEFFLIALAVVLFGGLFAGLALAYCEAEAERTSDATASEKERAAPGLYASTTADEVKAQELMLRELEHYLRREAMMAERFINNPSRQTLSAGGQQHIGTC